MEEVVLKTILEHGLIHRDENIIIGVSGGPDSMALLYLLIEIKDKIGFNIAVAHVNHGVRGIEAVEDEKFVRHQAQKLNIPYYSKTVDMVAYGKEMGISAEEAGRELRYGFFREILFQLGGGKIAVAHNANDQAETLLMRIFRGTGIDGLNGMEFISGDIIRPLLNISRADIERYIEENSIDTVLDKTNLMPIYTRNKIRLELIPYIEENFNPNIINTLWRLSQTSAQDSRFLEKYSEDQYKLLLKYKSRNCIILDVCLFNSQEESIKFRIIRRAIEDIVGNLQGFGELHISSVVRLLESGETGKEVHLPNRLVARIDYGELKVYKDNLEEQGDFNYRLDLGVNNFRDLGYGFTLRVLPIAEINHLDRRGIGIFDFDKIRGNLYLRNRRNGDRFIPFGMKGRKKLKDYFIDEKISRDKREKIPLIVDEENILWVVGYRTSNICRIDDNTKRILVVECFFYDDEEEKSE